MKNQKGIIINLGIIGVLLLITLILFYSNNNLKKSNKNAELKISILHNKIDSLKTNFNSQSDSLKLCIKNSSENLDELIENFENLYALNHIELYTKKIHKRKPQTGQILPLPPVSHRSLNIVKVDSLWLKQITRIIRRKPKLLIDYLNDENYNLATYILFIEIFNIDMIQVGHKYCSPTFYINRMKEDIVDSNEYLKFKKYKKIPKNINPKKYLLNKIWKDEAEKEAEKIIRDYLKKL